MKNLRDFWAGKSSLFMKKCLALSGLLLLAVHMHAQSGGPDFFRSIGKIYVVVAVIVTVLLGIGIFLMYLDRRLTKIENQIKDHD